LARAARAAGLLQLLQALEMVGRHRAIGAGGHQFPEQLLRVLLEHEVALQGRLAAGHLVHFDAQTAVAGDQAEDLIVLHSDALGVAYQIRDDLTDLGVSGETNDIAGLRPSLLLAIAHERAKGEVRDLTAAIWNRQFPPGITPAHIEQLYIELKADERARTLLETYKEEAIRCLRDLENASLKGLLRRLVGKIFNETEIKGWCKEFEQKNLEASPESITLHSPLAATPPPVTAGT